MVFRHLLNEGFLISCSLDQAILTNNNWKSFIDLKCFHLWYLSNLEILLLVIFVVKHQRFKQNINWTNYDIFHISTFKILKIS